MILAQPTKRSPNPHVCQKISAHKATMSMFGALRCLPCTSMMKEGNAIHGVRMQCKVLCVGNYSTLLLPLSHNLTGFLGRKMILILLMTCISSEFV